MDTTEPTIRPIGDSLFCLYPERAVFEFSRVVEHKDSTSAEVSVTNGIGKALYWARLNLVSAQSRASMARSLEEGDPNEDWRPLVERSVRAVIRHLRTGEPAQPLTPTPLAAVPWLVPGLIPRGQLTVLYGDGGVGKSYLALALALAGVLGRKLGRWTPATISRVLYLDWESGRDEQAARLWRLTQGLGSEPIDGAILHRTMRRPLLDDLVAIRGEVSRHEVELVIADSLAPACGPEPETATSVVPVLAGLRSLSTTVIILAHVAKTAADVKAPARPWGSVFIQNLARSTIECRRSDALEHAGEHAFTLSVYHRKVNDGQRMPPTAFDMAFDDAGALTITHSQPDSSGAGLSHQIVELLRNGPLKPGQMAEELDAKTETIGRTLRRLEKAGKVIPITRTPGGRSKESQWGLVDKTRTENPDRELAHVRVSGDDDEVPF